MWRIVACAIAAVSVTGCSAPTFGPPGRIASGGMPEPLGLGGFKASAHGLAGYNWTLGGGPGIAEEARAGVGLAPWLDVDLGAGHAAVEIGARRSSSPRVGNETWMGSALVRAYPARGPTVAALGVGMGVGCGGAEKSASLCDSGRLAVVGMFEADLGYRVSERWALYLVNRLQPSYVAGIPRTFWHTHMAGAEIDFPEARGLFIAPELGIAVASTPDDQWITAGGAVGVGIRFGGGAVQPR